MFSRGIPLRGNWIWTCCSEDILSDLYSSSFDLSRYRYTGDGRHYAGVDRLLLCNRLGFQNTSISMIFYRAITGPDVERFGMNHVLL